MHYTLSVKQACTTSVCLCPTTSLLCNLSKGHSTCECVLAGAILHMRPGSKGKEGGSATRRRLPAARGAVRVLKRLVKQTINNALLSRLSRRLSLNLRISVAQPFPWIFLIVFLTCECVNCTSIIWTLEIVYINFYFLEWLYSQGTHFGLKNVQFKKSPSTFNKY